MKTNVCNSAFRHTISILEHVTLGAHDFTICRCHLPYLPLQSTGHILMVGVKYPLILNKRPNIFTFAEKSSASSVITNTARMGLFYLR